MGYSRLIFTRKRRSSQD